MLTWVGREDTMHIGRCCYATVAVKGSDSENLLTCLEHGNEVI